MMATRLERIHDLLSSGSSIEEYVRLKNHERKLRGNKEHNRKRRDVASDRKAAPTNITKPKEMSSSAEEDEKNIPKVNTSRADFEGKYRQLDQIGEGGYGSVYAGVRVTDSLPVAIKHVKRPDATRELKEHKIPLEVSLLQIVSGGPKSGGKCAAVSLLDWFYVDRELIMVMERPHASINLSKYMSEKQGSLEEQEAKVLLAQLVEAAIEMHRKGVFHRDLKMANILIDMGSRDPRVRIIDFGSGTFVRKKPYRLFAGTYTIAPPEWYLYGKYLANTTTVWQLGALLHRMLHGTLFNTLTIINNSLHLSVELSHNCRDFLQLCLAIDPKQRGTLRQLQHHPWLR